MFKRSLLFLLLMAFMAPWAAMAQTETLTVYGTETGTRNTTPIYNYYFDQYSRAQTVFPATDLADMEGGTISAIKFYTNYTSSDYETDVDVDVYLTEVEYTTISAFVAQSDATIVYTGHLNFVRNADNGDKAEITITFTTPFVYNGGNLLFGCDNQTKGDYEDIKYYGKNVTGVSVYANSSSAVPTTPHSSSSSNGFLPKTTFTYTPNPYKKPANLQYTNVDPATTTVSWEAPTTTATITEYLYRYKKASDAYWPAESQTTGTSVTLTTLDAGTEYEFEVRANYSGGHQSDYATISFTTLAACMTPENLNITNVTYNSATFNWTEGYGDGEWKLGYKTGTATYTYVDVTQAQLPITLSGVFEEQTTYDVVVYPLCDATKTLEGNFTTGCAPTGVDTEDYLEDFDKYTVTLGDNSYSTPTEYPNDPLPDCWKFLNRSENKNTYPQAYIATSNAYAVSGKCLFFRSSNETPLYAILPLFEENISSLELTFTYRNEGTTAANGTLYAGYITNPLDASTFHPVYTCPQTTTLTASPTVRFLEAPAGSYIAFKYQGGTNNNYYASIDIVKVGEVPSCLPPTALGATEDQPNQSILSWTASSGESAWTVYYKKTSDANYTAVPNVTDNPYTLTGLTASTNYQYYVVANCATDDESEPSEVFYFHTGCPEYTDTPYSENFDSYSVPITADPSSRILPYCWDYINASTQDINKWYPTMDRQSTDYSHSSPNYLTFFIDANSSQDHDPQDQYAILPAMQNLNGLRLKLYARAQNVATNYDATFKVGVMEGNTFVQVGEAITPTATTYELYTIPFDSYTGTGNRIAIMVEAPETPTTPSTSARHAVYIDDITVEAIPACVEPSGLAEVPATATGHSLTFNWTAGGTETTWRIQYKKSTETEWTTHPTAVTEKPYELTGLDAASTYNVRVAAWCTPSDPDGISGYSELATATTECEDITITTSWTENFNSLNTNGQIPNCWDNATGSTTNANYKWCYYSGSSYGGTSGTSHDGSNCIRFESYSNSNGNTNFLKTPILNFPAGTTMQLRFWYKKPIAGCDFSVFISTDGGATYTTALASALATQTSWFEQEITLSDYVGAQNVVIVFKGTSNCGYGDDYIYLDDVTIEPVPTCIKPSALACDSNTVHTATLSWTNGEVGQDAWQIAYSTSSSFAPADNFTPNGTTEWLVDVTTNPATIEGLAQSTTYYAYVRANCGGGDYSAWCNAKVLFTTPAGNLTPTGLAVDASTITSSQATASWNAVAGNEYHQSYDIYWALATVTSVPEAPAAPNLISGISATSQVITGLDPETNYKVWVRDNCGTDGYSNWSNAVTFKTAKTCQTPDGLQESEVTDNSAKITWNTYGQTEFNLAYSADGGENWTTVNDIACPYTFPNNLQANKPYQVKVQSTCNTEAWSSVLNFRTECGAMTITATEYIDEDFEDYDATGWSTEGMVPYCWDSYSTGISYPYPHIVNGSSYNYYHSGASSLNFIGEANAVAYVALPEFTNDLNTLMVNFWMRTEGTGTYTLSLGYITAEDNNYNTYQVIEEYDNTTTVTERTTYLGLKNVPATATRLVFRWDHPTTSWHACCIDDVVVKLGPTCFPVNNLTYDEVLSRTVKLNWDLVDATQDAWQVQYATNAGFTEGVQNENANTNVNFILGGLTHETHYYVRVRGNCGTDNYGEWSNTVDFTTLEDCPAPQNLEVNNITQYTADLAWAGENDSYNIQYRTATQPTTNQIRFQGFEDGDLGEWTTVIQSTNATNQAECGVFEIAAKTGDYGFRFASSDRDDSSDTYDQYLISPELNETGFLEFAYKSSNNYTESFVVGYSTSTNDLASFEWGTPVSFKSTSWLVYSEQMPSNAKYFAIHYTSSWAYYVYIDDIAIYEMADPGEWTPTTAISTTEKSCQLTSLTAGTKYDVRVQGVCSGTPGSWSTATFETVPYRTFTNSGFWTTASNWTPAGVPGPNDDVAIARGADIRATDFVKVRNITLLDGGDIEIFSNSTSIGQLWHSNAGVQAAVRVSFYGYDPDAISNNNSDYFLIASPFANEINIEDTDLTFAFDGPTDPNQREYDMYMFDQSCDHQEWRNYKADPQPFTTMVNGQGYLYSNAWNEWHTRGMYGQLQPSNEDVTITLAYTEGNQFAGWNLVGNPFACNAYVKDATDNIAAYYRMNSAGNGFTAATGAIKTAEGIFVKATAAGQSFKFSRTEPAVTSPGNGNLNINLAQTVTSRGEAGDTDNAIVRFDGGGTLEKFSFRDNTAKVYIPQDHKDYAVVNAENEGVLPLNFKAAENGNYTLSFTAEDVEFSYLHLIDNLTGTEVDLLATPSYNFDARYTDYASRFKLVFAKADNNGSDNFAFISNGEIILSGVTGDSHVQLFDITGRMLSHTNGTSHFSTENLAAGVYVLRLINGNDVKTQRIVVR